MSIRKRTIRIISTLVLIPFLASCSAMHRVRLPNERDKKAILKGNKAIVLMRLSASLDDKTMEPIRPPPFKNAAVTYKHGQYHIKVVGRDTLEVPKFVIPFTPSKYAQKEGWVYLTLEPGNYCLSVMPPALSSKVYRFYVPKDEKVIYLGSFSVSCKGVGLKKCTEIQVSDETKFARSIVQKSFERYGPMSTLIVRNYNEPSNSKLIDAKNLAPMGLVVDFTKSIESPNWHLQSINKAFLDDGRTPVKAPAKAPGSFVGGLGWALVGSSPHLAIMLLMAYTPL
ncbi:MAG: hypothetical protein JRH15_14920, partial [Deltaproteobacteria bacterium]|nr:hypothetical protein [Deltaproteobacteria bacterium]